VRIYLGRESTEWEEALGWKTKQTTNPESSEEGKEGRKSRTLRGKASQNTQVETLRRRKRRWEGRKGESWIGKVPEPGKSFRG